MDDLVSVIGILAFIGTLIAAFVIVKVSIGKGKVEIENIKESIKEIKRDHGDLRKEFDEIWKKLGEISDGVNFIKGKLEK